MNQLLEETILNAPRILGRMGIENPTRPFFLAAQNGPDALKDYYAERIDEFLALDRSVYVKQWAEELDMNFRVKNELHGERVLARANIIIGAKAMLNVIKQYELVSPDIGTVITEFNQNQRTFADKSKGSAFTTQTEIEYIVDTLNQVRNDLTGELF